MLLRSFGRALGPNDAGQNRNLTHKRVSYVQKKVLSLSVTTARVGDELMLMQWIWATTLRSPNSKLNYSVINHQNGGFGRPCHSIIRHSVRDSQSHAISMKTLTMKLCQLDFHFNRLIIIAHRICTIDRRSIKLNAKYLPLHEPFSDSLNNPVYLLEPHT